MVVASIFLSAQGNYNCSITGEFAEASLLSRRFTEIARFFALAEAGPEILLRAAF
jgi:hypothetical protein